jgi:hypothetical protein
MWPRPAPERLYRVHAALERRRPHCGSALGRSHGHERFVFRVYDPFADFVRLRVAIMKLRITFYAESSDAHPNILANPTADFESLTDARETAFKDANKPDMRAHSIIIETVDDGSVDERWVRDGASETFVASNRPA